MESVKMSQKEYLRKYLSKKDDDTMKKKKKKKHKIGTKTVEIIDDDVDLKHMRPLENGEFDILNTTEDAPQICGIVDERGPVDFADKRRWKIIADDGDGNVACSANVDRSRSPKDNDRAAAKSSKEISKDFPIREKNERKKLRNASDSDLSPPRAFEQKKLRPDVDRSSRSKKKLSKKRAKVSDPESHSSDSSGSCARKRSKRRENVIIESNDRFEKASGENLSKRISRSREKSRNSGNFNEKSRADEDSDLSPPRRTRNDETLSRNDRVTCASRGKKSRGTDSDLSPPRARRETRLDERRDFRSRDDSRNEGRERRREEKSHKGSRWSDERPVRSGSPEVRDDGRMKKTLDGKTAGLQDARALRIETEAHKKREANLFKEMSAEVSGAGQATILRDRRTGRKRDLGAEAAKRREKEKRQEEMDEKYAKWGKGLKQIDDQAEKRQRDLYEMSKPLARYANDADLDKERREEMHIGDPMLEYMKKKYISEGKCKPERPSYRGAHLPNRFGIMPGHRWDGVDRSNGYEKKWFDARNARTALEEEAYKWSTADM